ncbi:MAG: hypothetical protein H0V18_14870 [Pyrinomonadaceae bacterium]|nr:hypothetical protein [Pyrinomonadaceae bacterium]
MIYFPSEYKKVTSRIKSRPNKSLHDNGLDSLGSNFSLRKECFLDATA